MRIHADHRRLFFGDVFDTPDGDVNIVRLYPNQICAWHCHEHQTDRLFCVQGSVRVGLVTKGVQTWRVLDERTPEVLTISPGTWHGYGAIASPCVLLQYNTPKYNPADEARQPLKKLPWD